MPQDQEGAMKFIMNNPAFLKRFKKLKINPSVLMDATPQGAAPAAQSGTRVNNRFSR